MNSMSDIVALKRIDMETQQREKKVRVPITPRLVTWNVNNERPNVYFPNINRSYISDLTYVPGHFINRRCHMNSVNREASWTPYTSVKHQAVVETLDVEESMADELSNKLPTLTDPIQHPSLHINKPLGLLKREYKHPLSMYEDALNNMYSRVARVIFKDQVSLGSIAWCARIARYAQHRFAIKSTELRDPTLPRQYHNTSRYGVYWYQERPGIAGKDWVTNRWRMWSGGSPSSPE